MKSFWSRTPAATMSAVGSVAGEPARFTSPDGSGIDTAESATAAPA